MAYQYSISEKNPGIKFHIIVFTHDRKSILIKTLEFYKELYSTYPFLTLLHVIDSSKQSNEYDVSSFSNSTFQIKYLHLPETGLYEKVYEVRNQISDSDLVLVSSDDDLYCVSKEDLTKFSNCQAQYAAPRWLMIKPSGYDLPKLWEAWIHFSKAARTEDSGRRVALFAGEGLHSFYGLFRGNSIKHKGILEKKLYALLKPIGCWSIVEDFGNLFTLFFDKWLVLDDSWCFRVLDRQFQNNKSWIPSWTALDKLRTEYSSELNHATGYMANALEIMGAGEISIEPEITSLLSTHSNGYKLARSRFWATGRSFFLDKNSQDNRISLRGSGDKERFDVVVPNVITFDNSMKFYFESEWLSSKFAISCFNRIPSDYFQINKDYLAS
jgi:hypothetical protein